MYVDRRDCEFIIPNVITPNNDGSNDCYVIKADTSIEEDDWSVEIYNRWGKQVYRVSRYKHN
jgi:gliding motility-associated-like protein